jgi:hypothetical protein
MCVDGMVTTPTVEHPKAPRGTPRPHPQRSFLIHAIGYRRCVVGGGGGCVAVAQVADGGAARDGGAVGCIRVHSAVAVGSAALEKNAGRGTVQVHTYSEGPSRGTLLAPLTGLRVAVRGPRLPQSHNRLNRVSTVGCLVFYFRLRANGVLLPFLLCNTRHGDGHVLGQLVLPCRGEDSRIQVPLLQAVSLMSRYGFDGPTMLLL